MGNARKCKICTNVFPKHQPKKKPQKQNKPKQPNANSKKKRKRKRNRKPNRWECTKCQRKNKRQSLQCECGATRPLEVSQWQCAMCPAINHCNFKKCQTCGEFRV